MSDKPGLKIIVKPEHAAPVKVWLTTEDEPVGRTSSIQGRDLDLTDLTVQEAAHLFVAECVKDSPISELALFEVYVRTASNKVVCLFVNCEPNTAYDEDGYELRGKSAAGRRVRCDVCARIGVRPMLCPCPESWHYIEVNADAESFIVWACSDECRESLWRKGPGERMS